MITLSGKPAFIGAALLLALLAPAGCATPPASTGFAFQRAALVVALPTPHLTAWQQASRDADAARRARCPALAPGCFGGADCAPARCFCPRLCGDEAARPVWVDAPSDCTCTA